MVLHEGRIYFDGTGTQAATDPALLEAERQVANMHCHTFYSFNAYGHSPTSLAWLAKRHGFALIGMVDFDVLDANPLDDIKNTAKIADVYIRGKRLDRAAMRAAWTGGK